MKRINTVMLLGAIALLLTTFSYQPAAAQTVARKLAAGVDTVLVGGNYAFWQPYEAGNMFGHTAELYSYNLTTNKQSSLSLASGSENANRDAWATDGKTMITVEGDFELESNHPLYAHDLATGKARKLPLTDAGLYAMAVDNGILFYSEDNEARVGTFAYNLKTGKENRLSALATADMVARDGLLAWTVDSYANEEPISTTLYLTTLASGKTTTVASGKLIQQIDLSGNNLAWTLSDGDNINGVYLYSRTTGKTRQVSTEPSTTVALRGDTLAWSSNSTAGSHISRYSISSGKTTTIARGKYSYTVQGITTNNALIYQTLDAADQEGSDLYSLSVK